MHALMTALLLLQAAVLPNGVTDPRTPALTPDGRTVCFSWRGDLWATDIRGDRAIRCLTPCSERDMFPAFSPDGSWLAFTSARSGGGDVYLMPAGGGLARRLTWHGGNDRVLGWNADSDSVLFSSSREGGEARDRKSTRLNSSHYS